MTGIVIHDISEEFLFFRIGGFVIRVLIAPPHPVSAENLGRLPFLSYSGTIKCLGGNIRIIFFFVVIVCPFCKNEGSGIETGCMGNGEYQITVIIGRVHLCGLIGLTYLIHTLDTLSLGAHLVQYREKQSGKNCNHSDRYEKFYKRKF